MIRNLEGLGAKIVRKLLAKSRMLQKIRFPRIKLAAGITMDVRGSLKHEEGLSLGRQAILIVPIGSELVTGKNCYIGRQVEIAPADYIHIGDYTSIQDRSVILGNVKIGSYCLFSYNLYISSGRHYFDLEPWRLIKEQDDLVFQDVKLCGIHNQTVIIEDDCWLGVNVVVMPGVLIGKGSIVGANSVVTRDVEPYSVVAGAPAKVLRKRLNFIPPRNITSSNASDRPYFYSGCKVGTKKSLGFEVGKEFVLALDTNNANSVHLRLACMGARGQLKLDGNSEMFEIPSTMTEVVFKLGNQAKNRLKFHSNTLATEAYFILQSAWVEA